jgi:hypothetical protein
MNRVRVAGGKRKLGGNGFLCLYRLNIALGLGWLSTHTYLKNEATIQAELYILFIITKEKGGKLFK